MKHETPRATGPGGRGAEDAGGRTASPPGCVVCSFIEQRAGEVGAGSAAGWHWLPPRASADRERGDRHGVRPAQCAVRDSPGPFSFCRSAERRLRLAHR
eukprot:932040-Prymnesium_polylepis.1